MIITYYGNQFFKIAQGDTTIAVNPPGKDSKKGKDSARFGSTLALSTTNHEDYNGFDRVTYGENIPFQISGPGEYEYAGVAIEGKGVKTTIDGVEYNTAVYSILFEEVKLGFLGPIEKPLLASEMEVLSNTDILFVPLGTMTPASANKLAVAIGAKIIIPMDYTMETLKTFLKETGDDPAMAGKPIEKLTIRRKEIEAKDGEVIVIEES